MTPVELGWLAGLIEGEGTFDVTQPKNRPQPRIRVSVEMTDEDVIRRLHELTGKGRVISSVRNPGRWKPSWRWQVQRAADVVEIVTLIEPMMGARRKRRIAEILASAPARREPPAHGTNSKYRYGCRCDACKAAHRDVNAKYR